uniref:Uncharacterized protein n=1 Tax=viral metagenome TaxID=1070528 RepID=A0A6M3ITF6_9ZZZZ
MNDSQFVTIRIKRETRDKLIIQGTKGQTYDDIITEIISRFDGPDSDRCGIADCQFRIAPKS